MEADRNSPPMNRMLIAVFALIGVLISAYLTLHKFGLIGSLVCGTGSCDTVQASKWAVFLGLPVPLIGLAGYAGLLLIALIGLQPAGQDSPAVAAVLFGMATIAVVFTVYLTYLEMYVIHAWCRWCIGSAIIVTFIWLFSLGELPRLRRAA